MSYSRARFSACGLSAALTLLLGQQLLQAQAPPGPTIAQPLPPGAPVSTEPLPYPYYIQYSGFASQQQGYLSKVQGAGSQMIILVPAPDKTPSEKTSEGGFLHWWRNRRGFFNNP
jgi:hypothetical protein